MTTISKVKVKMDSFEEILRKRKLEKQGLVQKTIDSEVIRMMAAYTPKDTGTLIGTATSMTTIGSGKVKQGGAGAPYARDCYYKAKAFNGAPFRGNYWFERAMQNGGRKSILKIAKSKAGV